MHPCGKGMLPCPFPVLLVRDTGTESLAPILHPRAAPAVVSATSQNQPGERIHQPLPKPFHLLLLLVCTSGPSGAVNPSYSWCTLRFSSGSSRGCAELLCCPRRYGAPLVSSVLTKPSAFQTFSHSGICLEASSRFQRIPEEMGPMIPSAFPEESKPQPAQAVAEMLQKLEFICWGMSLCLQQGSQRIRGVFCHWSPVFPLG